MTVTEQTRAIGASTDWWQRGVVYQIYPRSFADSDGDGVGDLPGIIAHLDHLQSLGVDAVWLSPIYPSPGLDLGYDVADHSAIDPLFGTMADFDRLVAAAHKRGIKVVLDLVMNHTSDQHAWFQDSRTGPTSAHADWYLWRDPAGWRRGRPIPPNNWASFFGGSGWAWDPTRKQFYLHTFLKEQPDLNWREPAVREAQLAMVRGWLARGGTASGSTSSTRSTRIRAWPRIRPGRRRRAAWPVCAAGTASSTSTTRTSPSWPASWPSSGRSSTRFPAG